MVKKSKHFPSLSDFNVNVIIQTKFELFIIRCSSIYATIVEPHRVKYIGMTHPFHYFMILFCDVIFKTNIVFQTKFKKVKHATPWNK